MKLGAFSVSLNVKDIHVSKSFYEKLGFEVFQGEIEQKWLILKNGDTVIGLFEGMFENNILTFNPGWDQNANPLKSFDDVRELEASFKENDLELLGQVDSDEGPGNFMMKDPDGNVILFDQHR